MAVVGHCNYPHWVCALYGYLLRFSSRGGANQTIIELGGQGLY